MNANSNGNPPTVADLEAEVYVLTGERNGSRRAAGRYKADRDRLRREVKSRDATIEMLSNVLYEFYLNYTGQGYLEHTDFQAAEEWLEVTGHIATDEWRDAEGKPKPVNDIPF